VRILFFSNPLRRRLLPLLPLARALRRQGHEAAFSTAFEAGPWLEPEGFETMLFGPDTHELTAEVARRTGADVLFSSNTDLAAELFAGARVDLMADEALDRAAHWAPDLIVSEHRDLVGPLVASALDVPCAVAVTGPAPEPGELDALAATVRSRYLGRGLPPPSRVPAGRWLLDLCPPSLQREGWGPWPGRIPLRAETTLDQAEGTTRTGRPAGPGRPRVLVGFGAEGETSLKLDPVIGSLSTLDVDLVVPMGHRQVEDLEWEPDRIRLRTGSPVAEDWEAVRAVVHHGGPEITLAAVARGIPAVVVPESPEQQEQAERLVAAGAGIALPARHMDPAMVTAGIGLLLSDPRFTAAASRIRDEIAGMPTAAQVARWLVASVAAERKR
jgi:L-noviosyl transferase